MIFTSNFVNQKNIATGIRQFSIARCTPKGITMNEYPALFPTNMLLHQYKANEITPDQFAVKYRADVLNKLDSNMIKRDLNQSVLFCYEKPGAFCHRILVRKGLADIGILSAEWQSTYIASVIADQNYKRKECIDILTKFTNSLHKGQTVQFMIYNFNLISLIKDDSCITASFNQNLPSNTDLYWFFHSVEDEAVEEHLQLAKQRGKIAVIYDYKKHKFTIKNYEPLVKKEQKQEILSGRTLW